MYKYAEMLYGEVVKIYEDKRPLEDFKELFTPSAFFIDVTGREDVAVGDVVTYDSNMGVTLTHKVQEELSLEDVKRFKIELLKKKRDTEELSPVSYGGYMWDFDDKAQMRINGGIVALSDGGTITWTSADNVEIRGVDADDLRNVIKSASVRSNAVHVKYRELRERVELANTVEEINNIKW